MESYNPHVDFAGDYEIDGRILLLPIKGKGRSNITMRKLMNIDCNIDITNLLIII